MDNSTIVIVVSLGKFTTILVFNYYTKSLTTSQMYNSRIHSSEAEIGLNTLHFSMIFYSSYGNGLHKICISITTPNEIFLELSWPNFTIIELVMINQGILWKKIKLYNTKLYIHLSKSNHLTHHIEMSVKKILWKI